MEIEQIMQLNIFNELKRLQVQLDKELYKETKYDYIVRLERYLEPFSTNVYEELAKHDCYYNDEVDSLRLAGHDNLTLVRILVDDDNLSGTKLMLNGDLKEIVNDIALNIAYDLGIGEDLEDVFSNY